MVVWKTIAVRAGILTSVGYAGWIAGSVSEKNKNDVTKEINGLTEHYNNVLHKLPGLPIFGTVSATSLPDKPIVFPDQEVMVAPKPTTVNRISQIMKFGFPGLDNVKSFDDYVLSYDRRNRVAHWVFEHLTAESVNRIEGVNRSTCQFVEDKSIHPYFRSTNFDYRGSGYDRGHLAAAGNHRTNQKHIEQTFLLSNMAPQVGEGFNRTSWNRLEKHVRRLTRKYCNIYVCTGPLYLPRKEADGKTYVKYEVIGTNAVAVPTHFFKVIVGEKTDQTLEMEAYVMPNQPISDETPLAVFQVPPESIERAAGLLFFDRISRDKLCSINGRKTTFV